MAESAVNPDEGAAVGDDLACMKCGYNLRTLAHTTNCPECGNPVQSSIEFSRRIGSLNFRPLKRGALFMIAASVVPVLAWIIVTVLRWDTTPFLERVCTTVGVTVFSILQIIGIIELGRARHLGKFGRWLRSLCITLALFECLFSLATWLILWNWRGLDLNNAAHRMTVALIFGIDSLMIVGLLGALIIGMIWTRGLAHAMHRPWLASLTVLAAVVAIMQPCISLLRYLVIIARMLVDSVSLSWLQVYSGLFDLVMRLSSVASAFFRPATLIALPVFWIVFYIVARRTARGVVPQTPVGILIDPHNTLQAPEAVANLRTRRAAVVAAMAALAMALSVIIALLDTPVPQAAYYFPAVLTLGLILFAFGIMLVAATCRRNAAPRHRVRIVAALLLTMIAPVLQTLILLPPFQSGAHIDSPVSLLFVCLGFLCAGLLTALRAFLLNTLRPIHKRRAALVRVLGGVALAAMLVLAFGMVPIRTFPWVPYDRSIFSRSAAGPVIASALLATASFLMCLCAALTSVTLFRHRSAGYSASAHQSP